MMMTRRRFSAALLAGASASLSATRGMAVPSAPIKARNVVLVHGLFADGSLMGADPLHLRLRIGRVGKVLSTCGSLREFDSVSATRHERYLALDRVVAAPEIAAVRSRKIFSIPRPRAVVMLPPPSILPRPLPQTSRPDTAPRPGFCRARP